MLETMGAEAELLARIKAGDPVALSKLYDNYAAIVHSFAERILRDATGAESVVQDVFLTVWRKAEQFRPERGSLCTWLLTLTRNKAIDLLRSSSRRDSRYVSISTEPGAFELPGPIEDPLSSAMVNERRGLILSALAHIPEEQKIPIYLNFYDGLSHPEIAERLGVPLGTVKTRIRLGLERLRVALRQASQ